MGFSRQEYWSGLPCPPPGDLSESGIKQVTSVSPVLQADSLPAEPLEKPLVDAAAAAKSLQSCPTLCDPMDCSLPGSSVHGIFPGKSTEVGCHCLLPSREEQQVKIITWHAGKRW